VLARALDVLHRRDGGRLLAHLIRQFSSFDLAEDGLQDAYAKALQRWPIDGAPDNPAAWIATVARRAILDRLKHRHKDVPIEHAAPHLLEASEAAAIDAEPSPIPDERLRLIFMCCHPAIAQPAQVALTLRSLCGLTTREISRAFVESESTTAQKLTRAKRKISQAGINFDLPAANAWTERLGPVLAVIYFVFNEGYVASDGCSLLRPDLCAEAIRLGRLIQQLLPEQAETAGLLALMLLHESRRNARVGADGALIVLEDQDRSRWDRALIAQATALLDGALLHRQPGPYQIQAAIAALHAHAPSAADTDWLQISALYGALLRHAPTPVVELNAAVALAMSGSNKAGLQWIERIERSGALDHYHLLHAAKADLLRRSGQLHSALVHYSKARDLAKNRGERRYLESRISELSQNTNAR
jgi:RNA polymerase sigma-70 factor (ECF subfamily)